MILDKDKAIFRWKHKPEVADEIRQNAAAAAAAVGTATAGTAAFAAAAAAAVLNGSFVSLMLLKLLLPYRCYLAPDNQSLLLLFILYNYIEQ